MTTWNDILIMGAETLFNVVLLIVLPYLAYLVQQRVNADMNASHAEYVNKLIDKAGGIVSDVVITIQQTFVDSLKAQGKFDAQAQKEAFERAKVSILAMLSEEAKAAIIEVYGSIEIWMHNKIESEVWLINET